MKNTSHKSKKSFAPDRLKLIRLSWRMTQAQFAELLSVPTRTYERWESTGGSIPAPVAAHIQTIRNLKRIYAHWDKIAQAIVRAGGTALTGENVIAAINDADALSDDHERLWGSLFPLLDNDRDRLYKTQSATPCEAAD